MKKARNGGMTSYNDLDRIEAGKEVMQSNFLDQKLSSIDDLDALMDGYLSKMDSVSDGYFDKVVGDVNTLSSLKDSESLDFDKLEFSKDDVDSVVDSLYSKVYAILQAQALEDEDDVIEFVSQTIHLEESGLNLFNQVDKSSLSDLQINKLQDFVDSYEDKYDGQFVGLLKDMVDELETNKSDKSNETKDINETYYKELNSEYVAILDEFYDITIKEDKVNIVLDEGFLFFSGDVELDLDLDGSVNKRDVVDNLKQLHKNYNYLETNKHNDYIDFINDSLKDIDSFKELKDLNENIDKTIEKIENIRQDVQYLNSNFGLFDERKGSSQFDFTFEENGIADVSAKYQDGSWTLKSERNGNRSAWNGTFYKIEFKTGSGDRLKQETMEITDQGIEQVYVKNWIEKLKGNMNNVESNELNSIDDQINYLAENDCELTYSTNQIKTMLTEKLEEYGQEEFVRNIKNIINSMGPNYMEEDKDLSQLNNKYLANDFFHLAISFFSLIRGKDKFDLYDFFDEAKDADFWKKDLDEDISKNQSDKLQRYFVRQEHDKFISLIGQVSGQNEEKFRMQVGEETPVIVDSEYDKQSVEKQEDGIEIETRPINNIEDINYIRDYVSLGSLEDLNYIRNNDLKAPNKNYIKLDYGNIMTERDSNISISIDDSLESYRMGGARDIIVGGKQNNLEVTAKRYYNDEGGHQIEISIGKPDKKIIEDNKLDNKSLGDELPEQLNTIKEQQIEQNDLEGQSVESLDQIDYIQDYLTMEDGYLKIDKLELLNKDNIDIKMDSKLIANDQGYKDGIIIGGPAGSLDIKTSNENGKIEIIIGNGEKELVKNGSPNSDVMSRSKPNKLSGINEQEINQTGLGDKIKKLENWENHFRKNNQNWEYKDGSNWLRLPDTGRLQISKDGVSYDETAGEPLEIAYSLSDDIESKEIKFDNIDSYTERIDNNIQNIFSNIRRERKDLQVYKDKFGKYGELLDANTNGEYDKALSIIQNQLDKGFGDYIVSVLKSNYDSQAKNKLNDIKGFFENNRSLSTRQKVDYFISHMYGDANLSGITYEKSTEHLTIGEDANTLWGSASYLKENYPDIYGEQSHNDIIEQLRDENDIQGDIVHKNQKIYFEGEQKSKQTLYEYIQTRNNFDLKATLDLFDIENIPNELRDILSDLEDKSISNVYESFESIAKNNSNISNNEEFRKIHSIIKAKYNYFYDDNDNLKGFIDSTQGDSIGSDWKLVTATSIKDGEYAWVDMIDTNILETKQNEDISIVDKDNVPSQIVDRLAKAMANDNQRSDIIKEAITQNFDISSDKIDIEKLIKDKEIKTNSGESIYIDYDIGYTLWGECLNGSYALGNISLSGQKQNLTVINKEKQPVSQKFSLNIYNTSKTREIVQETNMEVSEGTKAFVPAETDLTKKEDKTIRRKPSGGGGGQESTSGHGNTEQNTESGKGDGGGGDTNSDGGGGR